MRIWLVKTGEALPSDSHQDKLGRMGLIASELVRQGHTVIWFSSSFNHIRKEQRCNEDVSLNILDNLTIKLIQANSYKKNISIARIIHHTVTAHKFKNMVEKLEKPNIILCAMPTIDLAEVAVLYGVKHNIPVVIDIRDLWPDVFEEVLPSWMTLMIKPYIWYSSYRINRALRLATAITALTSEFLDWGLNRANRGINQWDKVFHISYFKNTNDKLFINNNWGKYGIRNTDFIISFIGSMGKQFDFESIIYAAKFLKDKKHIKFILCGVGETLSIVQEKAKDLPNIIFPGWIERKRISSLLKISSVGLAPYRDSENFTKNITNKFVEYLVAGLPILLGIGGVMSKLILDNNCGFTYYNAQQLVDAVIKLEGNRELVEKMSENAYQLFENQFNAKITYGDMVRHLESIVSEFSYRRME